MKDSRRPLNLSWITLSGLLVVGVTNCNQFPPIAGDQAVEANDVVNALQGFLKTQPGGDSIRVLGRGGNDFVSVYIYGARNSQMQQCIVSVIRGYVDEHPLRKDVDLKFYDTKSADGKDGSLLYSCVVLKYQGPWPKPK